MALSCDVTLVSVGDHGVLCEVDMVLDDNTNLALGDVQALTFENHEHNHIFSHIFVKCNGISNANDKYSPIHPPIRLEHSSISLVDFTSSAITRLGDMRTQFLLQKAYRLLGLMTNSNMCLSFHVLLKTMISCASPVLQSPVNMKNLGTLKPLSDRKSVCGNLI